MLENNQIIRQGTNICVWLFFFFLCLICKSTVPFSLNINISFFLLQRPTSHSKYTATNYFNHFREKQVISNKWIFLLTAQLLITSQGLSCSAADLITFEKTCQGRGEKREREKSNRNKVGGCIGFQITWSDPNHIADTPRFFFFFYCWTHLVHIVVSKPPVRQDAYLFPFRFDFGHFQNKNKDALRMQLFGN